MKKIIKWNLRELGKTLKQVMPIATLAVVVAFLIGNQIFEGAFEKKVLVFSVCYIWLAILLATVLAQLIVFIVETVLFLIFGQSVSNANETDKT